MGKFDNQYGLLILFDEKIFISSYCNYIHLWYRINDSDYFLRFNFETKEFEEGSGFGRKYKDTDPDWWKDPDYNWKEMSD